MNPTQEHLAPTVAEVLKRFPRGTDHEGDGIVFIDGWYIEKQQIASAFLFVAPIPVYTLGKFIGHTVQCIPPPDHDEERLEKFVDKSDAFTGEYE